MNDPVVARLKALADATRLRLLQFLEQDELNVTELVELLGMAQSRVSGHLAVLREADLVRDRRQGTSSFYSARRDGAAYATWGALRGTLGEGGLAAADRERLSELRRRRRERSREFFDRAAAGWDEERSESLGRFAALFATAALLPREMTVLDLGTGTGGLLPLLARRVDRVIALDSSRGMLQRAAERIGEEAVANVRLVHGDLAALPVPDRSVDGVVANMVLHHLPQPGLALREAARVLRPGGRGIVVDFETHDESWLLEEEGHAWPGFDRAQLAGWCVDAGLTLPEFDRVPTPETGRWSRLRVFAARFGRRR